MSKSVSEARAFSNAYTSAIYRVGDVSFTLNDGETATLLFEGRPYAVITAHNPRSEHVSDEENERRHQELVEVLLERHLTFGPSVGESQGGAWREEGVVIYDISLEEALELGRQFEQHAVLYGERDRVALAWCETGKLEWFYPKLV